MPSGSPDLGARARALARALLAAGQSVRSTLPSGWIIAWLLCLGVAGTVGASTATAAWVPGSDGLGTFAIYGVLVAGVLALVRRVPSLVGLPAALLAGALIAYQQVGPASVAGSLTILLRGDLAHSGVAFLLLLALLMWVSGGWLAWAVLRWRQPLAGLVPGAAALATNVLNTQGQNGFAFLFVAATIALLLWTTYRRSLDDARGRGLRLSSEARWDFWESGGVAGLALLAFGLFAPPLSTVDRTVDAQAGVIKAWSDVQVSLHHAIPSQEGPKTPLSSGFSDVIQLGHPLARNNTVVFTYKVQGSHSTPLYFRGVDIVATAGGQWEYMTQAQARNLLPSGSAPPYGEDYGSRQGVTVDVTMQRPPSGDPTVFFYPGQLTRLNRLAIVGQEFWPGPSLTGAQEALGEPVTAGSTAVSICVPGGACAPPPTGPDLNLYSIDRLSNATGRPVTGTYAVSGDYSVATADQLRGAGTAYPDWVQPYRTLADWNAAFKATRAGSTTLPGYLDEPVLDSVTQLAHRVTAAATNPYDQAAAIEQYLRSQFKYTLTPPAVPAGQDPLTFFLFDAKQGYCEYFATAMGDMLRALGIPTRLVAGYGPGTFSPQQNRFVVRESDAHTWVEAYFPGYGWIPFEPTPDGTYTPIPRGAATCHVDSPICEAIGAVGAAGTATSKHFDDTASEQESQNLKPVPPPARRPDLGPWVLGGLALMLAAGILGAIRLLSPRTPGAAWRRTRLLARLAGLTEVTSETPLEFGRRLADALPAAAGDAVRLARGFTLSAYGPPDLAPAGAEDVMAGWYRLRPVLLRRAAARAARRYR